jgi:GT2 family glycosyltransferase
MKAARPRALPEAPERAGGAPAVSIIVPVFNQTELLIGCLRALAGQNHPGPMEVIVVNNGAPGELARLASEFPDVVVVDEPKPGSYNARNAGIARAGWDILAFTDADCVPDPGWIANGIRPLLASSTCGLVGGRVRLVPRDPARPSLAELHEITFGFRQKNYVDRGHFAATANMLTRRDVVEAVGGFRGDLRSGGDADWGQRVFAAGYSLVYEDAASVSHPARDLADLMQKMRRAAAGERDRNPDWRSCIDHCLSRLMPPLHSIRIILKGSEYPTSPYRKLLLLGLATLVRWQAAFERLRLQLAGGDSPRS